MVEICFRYMPHTKDFRRVHKDALRMRGRVNWTKAFETLRYELARIKATDVVVEAGYKPDQLRSDGWPYSSAKSEHGQVRISFRKDGKPMSFFFGGWSEVEYNAYMIALTLKALRAVDRYGCTQDGEQYRGWSQLPPGGGIQAAEWASVEEARKFLAASAGMPAGAHPDATYRAAAKRAHPDAGGSNELMAKVNRARDFIEGGGAA